MNNKINKSNPFKIDNHNLNNNNFEEESAYSN